MSLYFTILQCTYKLIIARMFLNFYIFFFYVTNKPPKNHEKWLEENVLSAGERDRAYLRKITKSNIYGKTMNRPATSIKVNRVSFEFMLTLNESVPLFQHPHDYVRYAF